MLVPFAMSTTGCGGLSAEEKDFAPVAFAGSSLSLLYEHL
jgi:hypothetical protein